MSTKEEDLAWLIKTGQVSENPNAKKPEPATIEKEEK
jgi:hypothetical protein